MSHDFEKIGKQTVLNQLTKDIKGKSDYLQSNNLSKNDKLKTLKDLEKMTKEAHAILSQL